MEFRVIDSLIALKACVPWNEISITGTGFPVDGCGYVCLYGQDGDKIYVVKAINDLPEVYCTRGVVDLCRY